MHATDATKSEQIVAEKGEVISEALLYESKYFFRSIENKLDSSCAKIHFVKCSFSLDFLFTCQESTEYLFENCKLLDITFTGSCRYITFKNSHITGDAKIYANVERYNMYDTPSFQLEIKGCKFTALCLFNSSPNKLKFEEVTCSDLRILTDIQEARISNCKIGASIIFNPLHLILNQTTFELQTEIRFHYIKETKIEVENCKFLYDALFYSDRIFAFGEVKHFLNISRTTFNTITKLDFLKIENLKLDASEFKGPLYLSDMEVINFDIANVFFIRGIYLANTKLENSNRSSFRKIKFELLSIKDNLEAGKYLAKELAAYRREISFRNQDWWVLTLNLISNKNGQSWVRGCFFTLGIAVLFYTVFILGLETKYYTWGYSGWKPFKTACTLWIENFSTFFLPTHSAGFMNTFKPSFISYLSDFVGRIFISYGIFQTVAAFKRHTDSKA